MIRHKKILTEAAAADAGEVSPAIWNDTHLAFDFLAVALHPDTAVATLAPISTVPLELAATIFDVAWRTRYDFSQVDYVRLTVQATTPSNSNSRIGAQWSDDEGVTWKWFDGSAGASTGGAPQIWNGDPTQPGGGYNGGNMASAWIPIVARAKKDVMVRFVGWGALNADQPINYGAITLWAR